MGFEIGANFFTLALARVILEATVEMMDEELIVSCLNLIIGGCVCMIRNQNL